MAFRRGPPYVYQTFKLMKLTIAKKLLITISVVVACLICLIVVLAQVSLGDGFARYLARTELRKVEPVARHVERLYQKNGNWDFLDSDPELVWTEMQRALVPDNQSQDRASRNVPGRRQGPPGAPQGSPARQPHADDSLPPGAPQRRHFLLFHPMGIPPHIMELLHRVTIFDTNKNRIWGEASANRTVASLPLYSEGKQVGTLALAPGPSIFSDIESDFVTEQIRNFLVIAATAFILTIIASMILSRNLLTGIKALSEGTRKLSARDFSVRLDGSASDEIGQLARDFNRLADTLEKQDLKSKQWVSDTSHELRTPIAILRAQVEAFQDGVQEVNKKTLAVLHKEIMSLSKLVDDLYWLARFDVGKLIDKLMPMDVCACLYDTVVTFEERFKDRSISVDTTELAEGGGIINGDSNRIKQVFMNLLENSLRYTDSGGMVKVSCFEEKSSEPKIVLRFEDSAPAVPPAMLDQIFERFFRVESSRNRDFGGSGLGLSISKSIVEAHNGTISVAPSVLGGLKIEIRMPVVGGNDNAQ